MGCRQTSLPEPERPRAEAQPLLPAPERERAEYTPELGHALAPGEVPLLEQINRESVRVIARALPSLVRITSTHVSEKGLRLFGNDVPFDFNPHESKTSSDSWFGSGVIISRDGYIVTNQHVVEDGRNIQVQLHDRRTLPARWVAGDSLFDIAVLKIEASDLVALPWGNSDRIQVGEQVFAIGNPWDLGESVSRGIISAKGRNLPEADDYEDYIQTDAAINPGNSGGALVNIRGDLIGINAAIASLSRSNMGVGFAIPSNLARYAVEGLLKQGRLTRGFLGLNLTEAASTALMDKLGLRNEQGVLVAGVLPGSPAEKARLSPWDFITQIDGHKIALVADLRLVVAQLPVGKTVEVRYIRSGRPETTQAKIVEAENMTERVGKPETSGGPTPTRNAAPRNVLDGLQVSDLEEHTRRRFAIENSVTAGVIVTGLQADSIGNSQGLEAGDVIQSVCVDRGSTRAIRTAKDFTDLAGKLPPKANLALLVQRRSISTFVLLTPE